MAREPKRTSLRNIERPERDPKAEHEPAVPIRKAIKAGKSKSNPAEHGA